MAEGTFGKMILGYDLRKSRLTSLNFVIKDKQEVIEQGEEAIKRFKMDVKLCKKISQNPHPFIMKTTKMFQTERFCIKIANQCSRFNLKIFKQVSERPLFSRKNTFQNFFFFQKLDLIQFDLGKDVIKQFLAQLATALDFLHNHKDGGYILRSLDPRSLIVDRLANICITDLSFAIPITKRNKFVDHLQPIRELPNDHLAPEVIQGKFCNPSTDFFALGTVAYFLSTSNLPPTPKPLVNLDLPNSTPADLFNFVQNCLIPNLSQRPFQTFDDLAADDYFGTHTDWCDVVNKQFTTAHFFQYKHFNNEKNPQNAMDFVFETEITNEDDQQQESDRQDDQIGAYQAVFEDFAMD